MVGDFIGSSNDGGIGSLLIALMMAIISLETVILMAVVTVLGMLLWLW